MGLRAGLCVRRVEGGDLVGVDKELFSFWRDQCNIIFSYQKYAPCFDPKNGLRCHLKRIYVAIPTIGQKIGSVIEPQSILSTSLSNGRPSTQSIEWLHRGKL